MRPRSRRIGRFRCQIAIRQGKIVDARHWAFSPTVYIRAKVDNPRLWGLFLFRIARGEIKQHSIREGSCLGWLNARRTRRSFCKRIMRWDRPIPSSEIGRPHGHTRTRRSLTITPVSAARMPFSMAAMTRAYAAWALRQVSSILPRCGREAPLARELGHSARRGAAFSQQASLGSTRRRRRRVTDTRMSRFPLHLFSERKPKSKELTVPGSGEFFGRTYLRK